ncbi:MAG: VanZ family protein [Chitinophagales bacterium]|nr:VanZ family protein [Chitinophagales bacterium]
MNSFVKYNWPSILWAAFILVLCLMPGRDLPSVSLFQFDKLGHFGIYLILSVAMFYGWVKQSTYSALHQNTFLKIVLITSVYGFAVEVMQGTLTADRQFDIFDAIANSSGAVVGSLISAYLSTKLGL